MRIREQSPNTFLAPRATRSALTLPSARMPVHCGRPASACSASTGCWCSAVVLQPRRKQVWLQTRTAPQHNQTSRCTLGPSLVPKQSGTTLIAADDAAVSLYRNYTARSHACMHEALVYQAKANDIFKLIYFALKENRQACLASPLCSILQAATAHLGCCIL